MNWSIEIIPDNDYLYRRVHINLFLTTHNYSEIPPYAFRDNNGISVDWDKYSTPEQSQQKSIDPQKNCVIKLQVKTVKQFNNLSVNHAPISSNRAHSNINGLRLYNKEDQTDIRKRLSRAAELILKPKNLE